MISKKLIEEIDQDSQKEREEMLQVAEQLGIPYEEVVEIENEAMVETAKTLVAWDRMGLLDDNYKEKADRD